MEKANDNAKNILQVTYTASDNRTVSGTSELTNLLNKLAQQVNEEAKSESKKLKYRFLDSYNEIEAILGAINYERKITNHNFKVDIYEDLECKDVSKGNKYTIRISNTSGVYIEIDLLYYEEKIKDFEFDATEYIANNLAKIVGSVNKKVRELAPIVAEYIACIMYTKKLYKFKYNKVGWDYYIDDENNGSWIFKYDQIYSNMPWVIGEYINIDELISKYESKSHKLEDQEHDRSKEWLEQYNKIYGGKFYRENELYLKGHLPKNLSDGLGAVDKYNSEKEQEWVIHTIKLLNNHEYDGMILGAGISGLVRQLLSYTKETNININIVGKPASGKSTLCHYLLSIFGNPEKIEGSFIDTDNSMEEIRAKRPVLPYVLDDRMLKIETESEKSRQKIVLMDIFREYEGKVKERLGKQYEETAGDRIYGPIISSSVTGMMDYANKSVDIGQYRRLIEFNIGDASDKILFKDSSEASKTEEIAYKNYGFGITIIIDYMIYILNNTFTDEEKSRISNEATLYMEEFEKIKNDIEDRLKAREENEKNEKNNKVKGLTSSASRFALIVFSYQILRKSLLYYTYKNIQLLIDDKYGVEVDRKETLREDKSKETKTKEEIEEEIEEAKRDKIIDKYIGVPFTKLIQSNDIIKDHSDEIINILIDNLVDKMKGIKNAPGEQVNKIYDYIIKHTEQFKRQSGIEPEKEEFNKMYNSKGKYLGAYYVNDDTNEMTLYTPKDFYIEQFLFMEAIPEPETITEYVEYIFDNGKTGASKAKEYGKKYKTNNKYKDLSDGKRNQKDIELVIDDKKTIKKKDFRKIILKYTKIIEEDDKE